MPILPKLAFMEKTTFNKVFGEFVREKRIALNLSQAQLSDKMALDYQYISSVERGLVSPTLYWIVGLANAMELPLETFIKEFSNYSGLDTESIKS
jgi:transcriptional regulator with XRE-family HTH domain